jgi:hypothetical protein
MADQQEPQKDAHFIWRITQPAPGVSIMHMKMGKEAAIEFSAALYKMSTDPSLADVEFSFNLNGFAAQWESKAKRSELAHTSDKRH